MKKLLCLILGFTFLLGGPVYAEEYHPDISPAIEILRRQTKLRKSTSLESSIQFNKEEFSRLVGKGATHVTVLDLPEGGALRLNGIDLEQGQLLSLNDLNELCFVSTRQEEFQTLFHFKDSNKTNAVAFECVLSFSDTKPKEAESQWVETYRDCMTELQLLSPTETEEGWRVSIEHAPGNGLLNAKADGTLVYTPQTGYEGTDGFRYRYVHSDGRISEESNVRIRVNAPYRDVFFANLKNSPLHASAIDFCKYTNYEARKDENGNYFFDSNTTLTLSQAEATLQQLLKSQEYDLEVFDREEEYPKLIGEILSVAGGVSEGDRELSYAQMAKAVSRAVHLSKSHATRY